MKKTRQIDTYYCDYCGKECEHTPEYVFPKIEIPIRGRGYRTVKPKQTDICPKCQSQVAKLVNLLNYADFVVDDIEKMVYARFKNAKC